MTLSMPVKGVQRFRDRHGKWRHYHRKTGKPISSPWGTLSFLREVDRLNGLVEEGIVSKGGTLKEAFDEFRTTPAWTKDKAQATRTGYEKYFNLLAGLHSVPVRSIDGPRVATIRDRISLKNGSRTANYVLSVLSVVMGYAVEKGYAKTNPVKGVKRAKRERELKQANRPWTTEESQVVIEEAPWAIRVPLALAMYTGLRKADVLTLLKDEMGSRSIKTSKTGEEVVILVHPELRDILSRAPAHGADTIAATSRGVRWTSSGFDSTWDKFKRRLEREGKVDPGLTIHGLRHTVGGSLADAGCDLDTIRRVLGQKTLTMAQLYSERAKKRHATEDAVSRHYPRGRPVDGSDDEAECQTFCQTDPVVGSPGELSH